MGPQKDLKPRLRAEIKTFVEIQALVDQHKAILKAKADAEAKNIGDGSEPAVKLDVKVGASIFDDALLVKQDKPMGKVDASKFSDNAEVYVSTTPSLTQDFGGAAMGLKIPYILLGGNQMHKVNGVSPLVVNNHQPAREHCL